MASRCLQPILTIFIAFNFCHQMSVIQFCRCIFNRMGVGAVFIEMRYRVDDDAHVTVCAHLGQTLDPSTTNSWLSHTPTLSPSPSLFIYSSHSLFFRLVHLLCQSTAARWQTERTKLAKKNTAKQFRLHVRFHFQRLNTPCIAHSLSCWVRQEEACIERACVCVCVATKQHTMHKVCVHEMSISVTWIPLLVLFFFGFAVAHKKHIN